MKLPVRAHAVLVMVALAAGIAGCSSANSASCQACSSDTDCHQGSEVCRTGVCVPATFDALRCPSATQGSVSTGASSGSASSAAASSAGSSSTGGSSSSSNTASSSGSTSSRSASSSSSATSSSSTSSSTAASSTGGSSGTSTTSSSSTTSTGGSVTLTNPPQGATVLSPVTIFVDARPGPGTSITRVEVFDGAISLGSAFSAPFGVTAALSEGSHQLTAVATDASGNSTTSIPGPQFTVAAPPTAVLLGDTNRGGDNDNPGAGGSNGQPEAVEYAGLASGEASHAYLLTSLDNTAPFGVLAVYSDVGGLPGALLCAPVTFPVATGNWNVVSLSAFPIQAGSSYWLAGLAPYGASGGVLVWLRDSTNPALQDSIDSADTLTTLPSVWQDTGPGPTDQVSLYLGP